MMARTRNADDQTLRAALETEIGELVAVLSHYAPGKRPCFGAPSRCPDCGDFGMVTAVDHGIGRCQNECPVCKREWAITVRALNEHARRPNPMTLPHHGTGALLAALHAAEATSPPAAPAVPAVSVTPPPRLRLFRGVRQTMIRPA
jgi:hypothetical protein